MNDKRPLIGITMGDPVGIGPEIIVRALSRHEIYHFCKPLVIGDKKMIKKMVTKLGEPISIKTVTLPSEGMYQEGSIDVFQQSNLEPENCLWGQPTPSTGMAMLEYIHKAIDMAVEGLISALVTCPINKEALHLAGVNFSGHTEILAHRTGCDHYAMMLAGSKLRVVLVTIHIPVNSISKNISIENILKTIELSNHALIDRFGIEIPRIAVAGLNPHAGESGLFGNEENEKIIPAINCAKEKGVLIDGPFPADTLFYHAIDGIYDAVICMYHDQGLIPFKMIHFKDGVNTTIGLPIIRTSVDHGTAYDIAGIGQADPGSLIAAIQMAADHAKNLK